MATKAYMTNRIKFQRPQALLFSNNPGTLSGGVYIPTGDEGDDFIILSDHNRQSLSISKIRIETRNRMINGNMRSYHIADKISLSTSWQRLPSRSYSQNPVYNNGELQQGEVLSEESNKLLGFNPEEHTVDGGAGAADLLRWYEDHPGPFWVFMSYDKLGEGNLNRYTNVVQMFFSSFDNEVEKRGRAWGSQTSLGFDMWNVSVALEEV